MERRSKLKPKRIKFIEEYILSNNGTAAAIKAGYSAHSARFIASELLANAEVKAEFEIRYAAYKKKNEIKREFIVENLMQLISECKNDNDRKHLTKSLDMLAKMSGQYIQTVINKIEDQPLFPE
jgi:phage terminase small subunit